MLNSLHVNISTDNVFTVFQDGTLHCLMIILGACSCPVIKYISLYWDSEQAYLLFHMANFQILEDNDFPTEISAGLTPAGLFNLPSQD